MISLISHTVSFHCLGELQRSTCTEGKGTLTLPLEAKGCLCHIVSMWYGTYIGVAISMENIICHREVSRKYGELKTLSNTFQHCFVTFGLQLMVIISALGCVQQEGVHALTETPAVCRWCVKESLS